MERISNKATGFTLLELLITLAIISIISTIVIPSYLEHIRTVHRVNCQADLMELARFLERFYSQNLSYHTGIKGSEAIAPILPFSQSPKAAGAKKYYDLSVKVSLSPAGYILSAHAKNSQGADRCGTLQLTNTGAVKAKKGDEIIEGCW